MKVAANICKYMSNNANICLFRFYTKKNLKKNENNFSNERRCSNYP